MHCKNKAVSEMMRFTEHLIPVKQVTGHGHCNNL